METFEYLSDEAVLDSTSDDLKHHSIAETLKNIILKSPLPFTIGLFGRWGAGKSTIANFLKEKLNIGKKKIPVVIFDVWKYENDSLRRQFLFDLVKQLQVQTILNKNFKVDSQLTNSISKTVQGDLIVNKSGLTALVIILIAACIVAAIVFFNFFPNWFAPYTAFTIPSLVTIVGIATLLKYITQSITTETKTISNNKFSDPDQFENEFGRIIDTATAERIVIIFDNLDRVTHDKAIELLSTIKTFLEPKSKKCIFLVPCDEEAIKGYLQSVYTKPEIQTNFDPDEFLRKFFNTFIRIPDFIGSDLEGYTKQQLKITKVNAFQNNADLVAVITQAFRDNPRQIKQFINTLLSHFLLASEREKGKDPLIKPIGTITNNPQFLAKILVIKQKWPKFYSKITIDPNSYSNPTTEEGLTEFLSGTNITGTDNLRAFIYLKQPTSKLAIAGIESENLEIALKDNKQDEARKIVNGIKKEEIQEEKLFDFIKILFNENKGAKQTLVNIISVTEIILKELGISLVGKRDFCELITTTVFNELREVLPNLSLEFIFICLQESRPAKRNIINSYISILGEAKDQSKSVPEEFLLDLTRHINKYSTLFEKDKQQLKTSLTNGNFDNIPLLEVLFEEQKSIKEYISPELIKKLMESASVNDFVPSSSSNIFGKKMDLIFNDSLELDQDLTRVVMTKLTDLMNQFNQNPISPDNDNSLREILKCTEKIIANHKDKIVTTEADNMVRIINESLARIGDQTLRTPFIPTLIYIKDLVSDPNKGLIDTIINQYGQNGNLQSYSQLIEDRSPESAAEVLSPIKAPIENFGKDNLAFLDFIWPYENEDEKSGVILNLITNNSIENAINRIEVENYAPKEKIQIIQQLFDKLPSLALSLRISIYTTIKNMKFANDENVMGTYLGHLEKLLQNSDQTTQSNGYQLYIDSKSSILKPQIIAFIERLINWLKDQNPVTFSHKYPLQVVFSHWNDLNETYQDQLLSIAFEKILATSTSSIEDISMVSELIRDIKIPKKKLESHKKLVEDRITSETNEEIKLRLEEIIGKIK